MAPRFWFALVAGMLAASPMGLAQAPDVVASDVIDRMGYTQVACDEDELASGMAENVREAFAYIACGLRDGQELDADLRSTSSGFDAHAYQQVLDWDIQTIDHPTRGLDIHYTAFERSDTEDPAVRGAIAMVALPWFENRSLVVLAIGVRP